MAFSVRNVTRLYDRMLRSPCGPVALDADVPNGGHMNLGYWGRGATTLEEAGNALVDKLLEPLPEHREAILDVACGMGATTKRLAQHYPTANITGINISDRELAIARKRAPGYPFLKMDAAHLAVADAAFDTVISVEAASHFHTREQFVAEAFRVLQPGGWLVLSDLPMRWNLAGHISPRENLVKDRDGYEDVFRRNGFVDVTLEDATRPVARGFMKNYAPQFWKHLLRHPMKLLREPLAPMFPVMLPMMMAITVAYFLVAARKPED